MNEDYFDFLEKNSPKEKNTEKPHDDPNKANITLRADVDCQVDCDGDFLMVIQANKITKGKVPVGQHLIQFVPVDYPELIVEKIIDFDVPNKNYVLLINDIKQQIDNAMGRNKEDDIVEDVKPNVKTFTVKGVSFDMIEVKGGTFAMGGTPEQESDANNDEYPVHNVTLSDFYIGKFEVTKELWQAVMGKNPSVSISGNCPVDSVSWNDCQVFIKKLNRLLGENFRLPTEAEWEYAARGGYKSSGYKYSGSNNIDDVAWYNDNSRERTHPVGTKRPNELGIYNMSGNVGEWCQDWYNKYTSKSHTNPQGLSSGWDRVIRGGGWSFPAVYCRVSNRFSLNPDYGPDYGGFRLAL